MRSLLASPQQPLTQTLKENKDYGERYLNRRAVDYSNVEGDWLSFHWSGSQAESRSACVVGRLTEQLSQVQLRVDLMTAAGAGQAG